MQFPTCEIEGFYDNLDGKIILFIVNFESPKIISKLQKISDCAAKKAKKVIFAGYANSGQSNEKIAETFIAQSNGELVYVSEVTGHGFKTLVKLEKTNLFMIENLKNLENDAISKLAEVSDLVIFDDETGLNNDFYQKLVSKFKGNSFLGPACSKICEDAEKLSNANVELFLELDELPKWKSTVELLLPVCSSVSLLGPIGELMSKIDSEENSDDLKVLREIVAKPNGSKVKAASAIVGKNSLLLCAKSSTDYFGATTAYSLEGGFVDFMLGETPKVLKEIKYRF